MTAPRAVTIRRDRFLGIPIRPITRRRLHNFRANGRGFWSLWIFLAIFVFTLFAEFVANERPLVVNYQGHYYFPILVFYPDTEFGGFIGTEANYRDPYIQDEIQAHGWMVWPLIPFSHRTINYCLPGQAPAAPWNGVQPDGPDGIHNATCDQPGLAANWLGTDDGARDLAARLIYGMRISILFGLVLTLFSSIIGVAAGAVQGYFGGWTDLIFQRFIEIWSGMPTLYLLIIMSSVFEQGFWTLLILLLLFSWMGLVGVVRAEFLRARNFDYVRAARALGLSNATIIRRHVLPNATVATITFLPFILTGSISALTGLDFLGLGLPPGSASLGELLNQAKGNSQAPWLGLTAFFSLALVLSLLVVIGEGLRDAFDPRKAVAVTATPASKLGGAAAEPAPGAAAE